MERTQCTETTWNITEKEREHGQQHCRRHLDLEKMVHHTEHIPTEVCVCIWLTIQRRMMFCAAVRFDYPAGFCPHGANEMIEMKQIKKLWSLMQSHTPAVYSRCERVLPLLSLLISALPQGFLCVSSPWTLTWPIGNLSMWTAPTLFHIQLFFLSPIEVPNSAISTLCSPTSPNIPTLGVNQSMWRSKCPLLLAEWTFCPHPLNVLTKGHPVSSLLSQSRGMRGVVT